MLYARLFLILQAGIALAAALDLDRILVFQNPDSNVYLSDDYCANNRSFDSCYFLPISNCAEGEVVSVLSDD